MVLVREVAFAKLLQDKEGRRIRASSLINCTGVYKFIRSTQKFTLSICSIVSEWSKGCHVYFIWCVGGEYSKQPSRTILSISLLCSCVQDEVTSGDVTFRLADLKVMSQLGMGSSGVVNKVQHCTTGDIYALKVRALRCVANPIGVSCK